MENATQPPFDIVFVDMDDTFLTPEKTITPENLAILDAVYERGVQVVPCTGRNLAGIPREVLDHPAVHKAVCCNGALVVDVTTGEPLHRISMDRDVVRSLAGELGSLPITFDVFADGRIYAERKRFLLLDEVDMTEAMRTFIKGSRTVIDVPIEEVIDSAKAIDRLNIFYLSEDVRLIVEDALRRRRDRLTFQTAESSNFEVADKNATKGAALVWLCGLLGISPRHAVAFGDNINDVTMLEAAGDGVAMSNARDECKRVADHTTVSSCADSGVARYLSARLLETPR